MEGDGESGWQDEVEVMSDVHIGCSPHHASCTTIFTISTSESDNVEWDPEKNCEKREFEKENTDVDDQASDAITCDGNGDLILRRRPKRQRYSQRGAILHGNYTGITSGGKVTIHHQLATYLPGVGLQIWRGALLLGDFLLEAMSSSTQFHGVTAMELGAGTGLTGILMARAAKRVFITDTGNDILDNCTRNVLANSSSYPDGENSVRVRNLDWEKPWPPAPCESIGGKSEGDPVSSYEWSHEDLEEAKNASVLLAADVVYSPHLTHSFFKVLDQLLSFGSPKTLYLALEKRYNFTVEDLDIVAYGYHHFRTFFYVQDSDDTVFHKRSDGIASTPEQPKFKGRRILLEHLQQHLVEYERGKDLELWEIQRF